MSQLAKSLEEVLDIMEPKSISLLFEVEPGFTYDDKERNMKNVDLIDFMLGRLERGLDNPTIPIEVYLVSRVEPKEGDAQLIPTYLFVDPKTHWGKVRNADLVIIKRIDEKHVIVKVPEGIDILPYTVLE